MQRLKLRVANAKHGHDPGQLRRDALFVVLVHQARIAGCPQSRHDFERGSKLPSRAGPRLIAQDYIVCELGHDQRPFRQRRDFRRRTQLLGPAILDHKRAGAGPCVRTRPRAGAQEDHHDCEAGGHAQEVNSSASMPLILYSRMLPNGCVRRHDRYRPHTLSLRYPCCSDPLKGMGIGATDGIRGKFLDGCSLLAELRQIGIYIFSRAAQAVVHVRARTRIASDLTQIATWVAYKGDEV